MKIQLFDTQSNKPIANTKIQVQLKGKENGLLWVNTNYKGIFELEEKYAQHFVFVPSLNSPSIEAKENAILRCEVNDKKTGTGGSKQEQLNKMLNQNKNKTQQTGKAVPPLNSNKSSQKATSSYNKNDPFKKKEENKYKEKIKYKETI